MSEQVYVRDLDMNILYINPAAEKLTGWSQRDARGKKCYDVFGDDKQSCRLNCPVEKVLLENMSLMHHEGELKTRSGGIKKMRVSISPLKDNDIITGGIAVMQDITDLKTLQETHVKTLIRMEKEIEARKISEKKLEESRRKYKQLLDDIGPSTFLFSHDMDGVVNYASPSLKKLIGVTPEEAIGRPWQDVADWEAESLNHVLRELRKFELGRKHNSYEISFTDKKGKDHHLLIHSHFISGNPGRPDHIEGIATDITELKQKEAEREKLLAKLQEALENVKILSGLVPICSRCKKIRDDKGYWNTLESYLQRHSEMSFTHGLCAECSDEMYGNEEWYVKVKKNKNN